MIAFFFIRIYYDTIQTHCRIYLKTFTCAKVLESCMKMEMRFLNLKTVEVAGVLIKVFLELSL